MFPWSLINSNELNSTIAKGATREEGTECLLRYIDSSPRIKEEDFNKVEGY